jgi:hypothetical protein
VSREIAVIADIAVIGTFATEPQETMRFRGFRESLHPCSSVD